MGFEEIKTPFLHDAPSSRTSAGGWQLSGLSTWLQGFPGSVYTDRRQDDFNLDGNLYDFPNKAIAGTKLKGLQSAAVFEGHLQPERDVQRQRAELAVHQFSIAGRTKTGSLRVVEGNGGRNTIRGPGFFQVDGGLTKNTTLPWFFR